MNKYELMLIVKTNMESDAASKLVEEYKKIITNDKGEVTNFKDMGQKKLAYEINKEINGYYYVVNFNAKVDTINELNRRLRIDEKIIRHLIIKLDEE